jgi:hypothetical protein
MASDYSDFDALRAAKRLRAGDFIAQARATGITTRFDQSPARWKADGAGAADHDAANARDQ